MQLKTPVQPMSAQTSLPGDMEDARVLANAHEIRKDKKRHGDAVAHLLAHSGKSSHFKETASHESAVSTKALKDRGEHSHDPKQAIKSGMKKSFPGTHGY